MLAAAAAHRGSAFVEVYQNCNIFNDGAFDFMTPKQIRDDNQVALEHGKPLIFGKNHDKGIRLRGLEPEIVDLTAPGANRDDLLVHDAYTSESVAGVRAVAAATAGVPDPDRHLPAGRTNWCSTRR